MIRPSAIFNFVKIHCRNLLPPGSPTVISPQLGKSKLCRHKNIFFVIFATNIIPLNRIFANIMFDFIQINQLIRTDAAFCFIISPDYEFTLIWTRIILLFPQYEFSLIFVILSIMNAGISQKQRKVIDYGNLSKSSLQFCLLRAFYAAFTRNIYRSIGTFFNAHCNYLLSGV